MRFIEVDAGLRLRFPHRSEDFAEGFEMGALAAILSLGFPEVSREIAEASLDQARDIAQGLGYRMVSGQRCGETVSVRFVHGAARPNLRVVAG